MSYANAITRATFEWRGQPSAILQEIQPSPMVRPPRAAGGGRGIGRPVEQYDLHDRLIQAHSSLASAGKAVGIPDSNIHRAATGVRKTAGGFQWRFVDQS